MEKAIEPQAPYFFLHEHFELRENVLQQLIEQQIVFAHNLKFRSFQT